MDDEELNAGLLEEFHDAEDALSNTCRESKKSAATKGRMKVIYTAAEFSLWEHFSIEVIPATLWSIVR